MKVINPAPGMYFSAIRNRDNKTFVGQVESVKSMGVKGDMVVIKLQDSSNFVSLYLNECHEYGWSDFPLHIQVSAS